VAARSVRSWTCAIASTVVAALVAVFALAQGPPQTWVATELPVIAGWAAMLRGCAASRRLRMAVAAGTMSQAEASRKSLPFLFFFPASVAAASAVALAISKAAGLSLSHMSFLLPYATAFWGLVVAGAACIVHSVLVGNTRVIP